MEISIEERVARLEGKLGWRKSAPAVLSPSVCYTALGLAALSVAASYRGLGAPNHHYQVALALLTLGFLYHRRWLIRPEKPREWLLAGLSAAALSMQYKLLIGVGVRYPFSWVRYPVVERSAAGSAGSQGWIPNPIGELQFAWQMTELAAWSIDITVIQTFFLLITLLGCLVDFQPFISLTAFFLLLVSLPAFTNFDWNWVFPSLVLFSIALYLQSSAAARDDEP